MNDNSAKSIATIINSGNSYIKSLIKKAETFQDLEHKLKSYLNTEINSKFELASVNQDVAILITSSSSMATRLRYNIPEILSILQNQLAHTYIKIVRVKLVPNNVKRPDKMSPSPRLSAESAELLMSTANNIQDSAIRESLLRIARHTSTISNV